MSNINNLFTSVDATKGGAPIFNTSDIGVPKEDTKEITKDVVTPSPESQDPVDGWEKRYKDLQAFKDTQLNEYKDKMTALEDKLTEATKPELSLPRSAEEILKFKESNKDLYESVQTMIQLDLIEKDKEYTSKLEKLESKNQEMTLKQKEVELLAIHTDATEIKQSEEFKIWFKSQTPRIKELLSNESSVTDWSTGLSLYKGTISTKDARTKAAEDVIGTSKGQVTQEKTIYKESEIKKLANANPKWWVNNRGKVNKAMSEGRVILDISKKQ